MTTSTRPTDSALTHFRMAGRYAGTAGRKSVVSPDKIGEFNLDMSIAFNELASGLVDMTQGLRATYLLLEKLERDVRELQSQRR